jgi:hypothetical protein
MGEYDVGLKEWSTLLLKILDKFIEAFKGKVDQLFWNQIINKEMGWYYGYSSY